MTATDIVSIVTALACAGAFSLVLLLVCARVLAFRHAARLRSDATRGLPAAPASTPFIEMPAHLKTRQEIVDWMQHDLPRQTAGLILSDRD
jgi:hypothetical protein